MAARVAGSVHSRRQRAVGTAELQPRQAKELDAFVSMVESETWVSQLVKDLIYLNNSMGHVEFAAKTDFVRDMVSDALQQFELDVDFARKLVRQHPNKFCDIA